MNRGKIPENVLKRSILKHVKRRRGEILRGASVGGDCAVLRLNGVTLSSTEAVELLGDHSLKHAVVTASNNISAGGGEPVGISVSGVFPVDTEESYLRETVQKLEGYCRELKVDLVGGSTMVSDSVRVPVISVTAVGQASEETVSALKGAAPGDSVVLIGKVALEGTAIIAKAKEEELLKKYPADMIYRAESFDKLMSVKKEAALAVKSGVTAMHDVSRGGIFAALWELAERSGVGLEADLRKLSIFQESVEICNFFDINPYELLSGGALLAAANDPEKLVLDLAKEGIEAVTVGMCTDSKDRVLLNGESKRFLEIPKTDEIYKVI
ncbi:MAG: hydrogenase maturation factor [Lachnospiraceae bacterium]|nr:hydrogenase maturation factor [Lachnospiraceae bacterium]